MTIKFSPESPYDAGIIEFEDVNFVVTVTDEAEGSAAGDPGPEGEPGTPATPPTTTPVVIKSVAINDSGITVTIVDNTFTVSGKFLQVFDKQLSFRDATNAIDTVKNFAAIPKGFNTLFEYIAPVVQVKNVIAAVVLNDDDEYQYEIVVNHNFTASNNALKVKVSEGKF